MKRLSFFIMAALIAACSYFITGCGEGSESDGLIITVQALIDGELYPKLFDSEDTYANNEIRELPGTKITFTYTFDAGPNRLKEVSLVSSLRPTQPELFKDDFPGGVMAGPESKIYTQESPYVTEVGTRSEILTFEATDTKGLVVRLTIVISPIICTFELDQTAITLEAQDSPSQSCFYSVSKGTIMTLAQARSNPADVDFIYYHDDINAATIASPTFGDLPEIFSVGSWSKRNNTRLLFVCEAPAPPPAEWWDEFVEGIDDKYPGDLINMLYVGDIYAFKTDNGTKGAFTIESVEEGPNGYVRIKFYKKNCD